MLKLIIIHVMTTWNRVPFVKQTVAELAKKFPRFYATRTFVTVFTRSRNWSLSCRHFCEFRSSPRLL